MKIGVVSDTHSLAIPDQMIRDFRDVDFIIHAGDFCSWEDYQSFSKIKEVKAVFGNMDDTKLTEFLPEKLIFNCDEVTIGVTHGAGSSKMVLESVKRMFKGETVDMVIFGHSHMPYQETHKGILYFNPGSPNDIIRSPYCSYGLLEVACGKISAKIIKVN